MKFLKAGNYLFNPNIRGDEIFLIQLNPDVDTKHRKRLKILFKNGLCHLKDDQEAIKKYWVSLSNVSGDVMI
jgi:hypothetical protein